MNKTSNIETEFSLNNTSTFEIEQWKIILDQCATIAMPFNTILLMLAMGANIQWKDVSI